jgi:REP element-mobilizing transposase RayT
MGNSFISNYIHCVFSTKNHHTWLNDRVQEKLFPYFGGIARDRGFKLIKAGGVEDHVHLLISLPATLTIGQAMQYLKGGSSRWIHSVFPELNEFSWQEGYGAFSVSISQVNNTITYIDRQIEHHREKTFQEELIEILKLHGISFEEKYLL